MPPAELGMWALNLEGHSYAGEQGRGVGQMEGKLGVLTEIQAFYS